ncbi:hypothetical protein ACES2L_06060 [Bdellovibrio bacteriovorus]
MYSAQILDGSSNVLNAVTLSNTYNPATLTYEWRDFSVNYPCAASGSRKVRIDQTTDGSSPVINIGKLYYGLATNVGKGIPNNTFVAYMNSAGTIGSENEDWINGNCAVTDTSLYTCTLITGKFSRFPICTVNVSVAGDATTTSYTAIIDDSAMSATTLKFRTNGGGSKVNLIAHITCTRAGSDFIQPTISPNNFDYDWTTYSVAVVSDTGTIPSHTVNFLEHKRASGKLYLRGKITFTGTGTWNGIRIPVPTGVTLNTVGPVQSFVRLTDTGTGNYRADITSAASTYLYLSAYNGTNNAEQSITQAAPFTWASGDIIYWEAGPIDVVGWGQSQGAPLLVGSVTSNYNGALRVEHYKMTSSDCTTGTCASDVTTSPGIAVTWNATGTYDVTFSPAFSVAPVCVVSSSRGASNHLCQMSTTSSVSSTQVNCAVANTGAAVNTRFSIQCIGVR